MYTIGVDYGTESGRVLIVNIANGEVVASEVIPYPHGVITEDERIPYPLPKGAALQDPADYVDVLTVGIPRALEASGIAADDIVGIGFDFTASTILPIDKHWQPLCQNAQFRANHHAYVKLWKHQLSIPVKDRLYKEADARNERWFRQLGHNISEEWAIPKIVETFEAGRDVYNATYQFIEAGDWVTTLLTGQYGKNNCALGFKMFWTKEDGFPTDYFKAIDEELGETLVSKLEAPVINIGETAGTLSAEWSEKLGLNEGITVATCMIDAHAGVVGTGIYESGALLMVMGTSTCHLMVHDTLNEVKGISGVVADSIIPGLYGYEAGQPAVGDLFASFVDRFIPAQYEAESNGSIHRLLEQKASELRAGESGLIALDWHNGTRSILSDPNLSGMLVGLNLNTKPEEIYRAYLEATAYSARRIIDTYAAEGMNVTKVVATGGLPQRNALLMQIYANVLNQPITISDSEYAPAIGAAILAAAASGAHSSVQRAIDHMAPPLQKVVMPNEDAETYQQLYALFNELHDYFGIENASLMRRLKTLRH